VLINVLETGFLNYIIYSHYIGRPRKSLLEKIKAATNLKDLKIAYIKAIGHPDYFYYEKNKTINDAYNIRKEKLIDNDRKKELDSESIEIKTQC